MAEPLPGGQVVTSDPVGPENAPLLVLLGALGTTSAVWGPQMGILTNWFRVLQISHPGHGGPGGERAPKGPYTVEGLGKRVVAVMDALGAERAHIVGLSLGGLVGMWLAAERPQRVERLVVCCSTARFGTEEMWLDRAGTVRAEGMAPLLDATLGRWFTPWFLEAHPEVATQFSAMLLSIDPEGYASCCEALASGDLRSHLGQIEAPTLVVGGAHDPVVPPDNAAATMAAIPQASLRVLTGAAHLASVEQPDAFNNAVMDHLVGSPSERGLGVRRRVLGEAHVDRSLASASEFSAPFQDLLSRWPWGEVWARPGLDRRSRRLVTIAMLVALGRRDELEMHMREALVDRESGLSSATLRELLLQTAVYAGVPAANTAFAIADRLVREMPELAEPQDEPEE
jgi:3-oxoadipate enol-lactonase / 4-carboxymuconolactone decarboxylase